MKGSDMTELDATAESRAWCERFLRRVEARSASVVLPFTWVAGGVFDDRFAVVVYREAGNHPTLSGRVYEASVHARAFEGSMPEEIADTAVAGDITDPSGPGEPVLWAWAQQLAATTEPIGWHSPLPDSR
jgi:hypothetical protein